MSNYKTVRHGYCAGRKLGVVPAKPDYRDWTAKRLFGSQIVAISERASVIEGYDAFRDQGSEGSCGPHSVFAAYVVMARAFGIDRRISPQFAYWISRYKMGTLRRDSGVDNRAMLKALMQYGACSEELWPYATDMYAKPNRKAFQDALKWQLKDGGFAKLTGLGEARGIIDRQKRGVVVAVPIYESFESAETLKSGIVPVPDASKERLLGYHDMFGGAYDDKTRRFTCVNSWGPNVGAGGLFHLPYEYPFTEFWAVEASELGVDDPKMNFGSWEMFKRRCLGMA